MGAELTNREPFSALDTMPQINATANETSTDEKYLAHEFVTYQGWQEWAEGYTPPEAREAVLAHLRGWMYQSASLSRHCLRLAYILGALARRSAPTERTQWAQTALRGPKWAAADLDDVWCRQFRPSLEEKLRDVSMMGGSLVHIHHVDDVDAGVKRLRLKRWPHEAIYWRAESPGYPGGYYAITSDSGLVRITPGDGHWAIFAHGERWHEFGAVLSVGELFPPSKLSERDEAGLSEAAGRAFVHASLGDGIKIQDENGKAVQKALASAGRARTAMVSPHGTEVDPVQITSDTQFFDRYSMRQLVKIGYAILGIPSPGPGASSTYTPIVGWSVDEALVDKDHEALVRGWNEGIARPFCDVNGIDGLVRLSGERYASPVDRAVAEATRAEAEARTAKATVEKLSVRALALAVQVRAWRDAGLAPTQADVDARADELGTPTILLGAAPAVPVKAPGDIKPAAESPAVSAA